MEETTHSAEEGVAEKSARTERCDTEMDTERGGDVGTSQLQIRNKKEHMTNIYLTDSDEGGLWTFSRITRSSTTRPTSTLRTRPGRNACGRGSPTATTSCL